MTDPLPRFPQAPLDPAVPTGLILCGMGGPDGPDAVQPFLRNLFRDPLIFPVPRLIAGPLGRLIAWRRAPAVRRRYAMVSKKSVTPQLATTRRQAEILAQKLSDAGRPTLPGMAMRYWHPFPDRAVAELGERGAGQFLVVPMYPQYSGATNGSTIEFVLAALAAHRPDVLVHVVPDWHLLSGFIAALAKYPIEILTAWADAGVEPRECALLYVAHSLPQRLVNQGDPYRDRTLATVQAVQTRVTSALHEAGHTDWLASLLAGGREAIVTYQSKVGPIKWLGPQIDAVTPRLGARGARRLCVQPVSFTCEHIETLLELDVDLKASALRAGFTEFQRGRALNLDATWLESLTDHLLATAFAPEVDRRVVHS